MRWTPVLPVVLLAAAALAYRSVAADSVLEQ